MKIDELIEALNDAKNKYGNIEVINIDTGMMTDYFHIRGVEAHSIKGKFLGNNRIMDDNKYLIIN